MEDIRNLNKKKFLFCYPHTLTIGLEAPVYRGFSGEGKCEGKSNEELRMKNEELSASPIKKQRSAAEGKANLNEE